jgi:hypothetical protein
MNKISDILYLISNNRYKNDSSDIMEHIITLFNYAKECNSVFETGVRGCISSWAFLGGLLNNNNGERKRFLLNDIEVCDINDLLLCSSPFPNIDVSYVWKNNLEIDFHENYDITFIDTWHVFGQLKRELAKFSKITNKYIIMHDTTIDEIYGESIRGHHNMIEESQRSGIPVEEIARGLGPAIIEFLQDNPDWYLKEKFTNNNGLTILAKR